MSLCLMMVAAHLRANKWRTRQVCTDVVFGADGVLTGMGAGKCHEPVSLRRLFVEYCIIACFIGAAIQVVVRPTQAKATLIAALSTRSARSGSAMRLSLQVTT